MFSNGDIPAAVDQSERGACVLPCDWLSLSGTGSGGGGISHAQAIEAEDVQIISSSEHDSANFYLKFSKELKKTERLVLQK